MLGSNQVIPGCFASFQLRGIWPESLGNGVQWMAVDFDRNASCQSAGASRMVPCRFHSVYQEAFLPSKAQVLKSDRRQLRTSAFSSEEYRGDLETILTTDPSIVASTV